MRQTTPIGLATAVVVVLAACSSSGARQSNTPTTASNGALSTSVDTTARHPTTTSAAVTTTTGNGGSSTPSELNPAGDIPDNQVFVRYAARTGTYSLVVPEGWARTENSGVATFTDHFNSIRVEANKQSIAPTVATARAIEVPALQRTAGFNLGDVTSVSRTAGLVVRVTYRATSAADPVTAKRVVLDVDRYEFWRSGTRVTITLSAPQGSDNIDPWRKVTDSFAWSV